MKFRNRIVVSIFALVVIAGCASTKVTEQSNPTTLKLARPDHIWVMTLLLHLSDVPTEALMSP